MKGTCYSSPESSPSAALAAGVLPACIFAISAIHSAFGGSTPIVNFELNGTAYWSGAMVFSRDLEWLLAWRLPDQVEVWELAKESKLGAWTAGSALPQIDIG